MLQYYVLNFELFGSKDVEIVYISTYFWVTPHNNISSVWCFLKSARPNYHLFLNLIKNELETIFFLQKKSIFEFFTKKNGLKDIFSESLLDHCPFERTHIFRQIIILTLSAFGQKNEK